MLPIGYPGPPSPLHRVRPWPLESPRLRGQIVASGVRVSTDEGCNKTPLAGTSGLNRACFSYPPPEEWESACFTFARALRIVRTSHDVLPVVEAVARGEMPARPKPERSSYLVRWSADRLGTVRITEREADLTLGLLAGRSFGSVCEAARSTYGAQIAEIVSDAVRALLRSAERRLLVRCTP